MTMSDENYAEIVVMLQRGNSVEDIVAEFVGEVSASAVYNIRKEMGIHGSRVRERNLEGLDLEGIVDAYNAGISTREIVKKFDLRNTNQVYSVLAHTGTPRRKYSALHVSAKQVALDDACEMYEAGYFLRDIVGETGVSQPRIHDELAKRGIPLRRPRTNTRD